MSEHRFLAKGARKLYISSVENDPLLDIHENKLMDQVRVSFRLGFDDETKQTARMIIEIFCANELATLKLTPGATPSPPVHQFRYFVKMYEENGNEVPKISFRAKNNENKQTILNNIIDGINKLIAHVNPNYIERYTADQGLPFKALIKYMKISEAIFKCGYDTKIIEERDGQGYWLHERRSKQKDN